MLVGLFVIWLVSIVWIVLLVESVQVGWVWSVSCGWVGRCFLSVVGLCDCVGRGLKWIWFGCVGFQCGIGWAGLARVYQCGLGWVSRVGLSSVVGVGLGVGLVSVGVVGLGWNNGLGWVG